MWWVFAVGNWIFLWPWQTCWLTVYIGRQRLMLWNTIKPNLGCIKDWRTCHLQEVFVAGASHQQTASVVRTPLPFTRTSQQKQKGFPFSLSSLIESSMALNPSNSEHEPLKFSEIKAWFYHRSQRQASFIGRDSREKHVGRSQLHLKVSWVEIKSFHSWSVCHLIKNKTLLLLK